MVAMKILLVVNPISGSGKGKSIAKKIKKWYPGVSIIFTEKDKSIDDLLENVSTYSFDRIGIVGGDGSVNMMAKWCLKHEIPFGIIPIGSGNGLARHLKIPLNWNDALKKLMEEKVESLDVGDINGHFFFNMAGLGFEGEVIDRYEKNGTRGLLGYVLAFSSLFFSCGEKDYQLTIDGEKVNKRCLSISIANSEQYGNNFKIAPNAETNDGWLDLVFIECFGVLDIIQLIWFNFFGTVNQSKRISTKRGKDIVINSPGKIFAHIDGEKLSFKDQVKITILDKSIKIYK